MGLQLFLESRDFAREKSNLRLLRALCLFESRDLIRQLFDLLFEALDVRPDTRVRGEHVAAILGPTSWLRSAGTTSMGGPCRSRAGL